MAAAAAAPNPKGLGMCCKKAAAVAGSLKLGSDPGAELGGKGGDVTDEGVFEADGVSRELTLKSDEGLGEVNTVVVVEVDAEVEAGEVGLGGGVFGGVEGEPPGAIEDDETSSMSTDLCSWSLICSSLYFWFGL